jgi:uncharacterized repeat protein (TIGR04044 family)
MNPGRVIPAVAPGTAPAAGTGAPGSRFGGIAHTSINSIQATIPLPFPPKAFASMPEVTRPANQPGDFLVDYEEKVFPDVKAEPGEKALVTFHTVAFEGSIGLVNLLQASRLINKGFDTSILLYGPGVTLGVQRGFPKLGDAAFDGHLNFNARIQKFMDQGGKVYACRFALQALYGHGEGALIPGVRPINPLDVLDIILMHRKEGAFILDTWTL